MKARLIGSLPGVLPDSLEIHGDNHHDEEDDGSDGNCDHDDKEEKNLDK